MAENLFAEMVRRRCFLPLQCLNEFYYATTRKGLLAESEAQLLIEDALHSLRIVPPSAEDLVAAITLHQVHHVHFYDALLWVTSYRAGCTIS